MTLKIIDFRTDTNIQPTKEMIDASFNIKLGDAVYDLDTKTIELENYSAAVLGKEASIFIPSGVMGNLIALLSHTQRGQEIILEENAHIRTSETGGAAYVGGLMMKTIRGSDGAPTAEEIENAIRPDDQHYPRTGLICLENTHYRYGGIVFPMNRLKEINKVSKNYLIPIHLDGARLFNAAVYLGTDVKELTKYTDSVMISLSKGLGAPVGSILAGEKSFIQEAKRFRKMLGGGMRKIGWLSSAGLFALKDPDLKTHIMRDHENAKLLGEELSKLSGVNVNKEQVQTNMVLAYLDSTKISEIKKSLETKGIFVAPLGKNGFRFYTSRDTTREDVIYTISIFNSLIK